MRSGILLFVFLSLHPAVRAADPVSLSGIYPHLTMFNSSGECGTGAVVPWQGKLWIVTYAPHSPKGSDDKLYSVSPDLIQAIHPESIGGTPANRLIHNESKQLFIGPYAVGADSKVRAIPYTEMFGRPTGTARHLTDPAGKVVTATMEEGIYEIGAKGLKVTELWGDEDNAASSRKSGLPGYHGKGFYSGQGVYVYSNNGERGNDAKTKPETSSGVLAEWDGKAEKWTIIRRNQFTEVTGSGGIYGNPNPATDPIWTVGWDHRSLLLGVRMPDSGWTFYRLPKGSHSYDGAHGWNTEWPRIREIGKKDFLMTMHGTFWNFPPTFTPKNSSGIAPRSNYLKVIGDFAEWNGKIVLGCDDTAKSEFLNKRKAKGHVPAPQSQSNLWFVDEPQLDKLGPAIGRGAVWVDEAVKKDAPSDAFLFSGYARRAVHLAHSAGEKVTFRIETDIKGDGEWTPLAEVDVPASGYLFVPFAESQTGAWARITSTIDLEKASAVFTFHNPDTRNSEADAIFGGIAKPGEAHTGGAVHAFGDRRTLGFHAVNAAGERIGTYELDSELQLKPTIWRKTEKMPDIPTGILTVDAASVLYVDDNGKRWRLPKGDPALDKHEYRVCREVATERDLFNAHGTFYELPAENAGGFAKARPVATHNRLVHDYCSYRGLFVVSGIVEKAPADNPHIIRSAGGEVALWAGAIDDIWKLGKPRGHGGPWQGSAVEKDIPSDPYLLTAYDRKTLTLRADRKTTISAEIDLTGEGRWSVYETFEVKPGEETNHTFPVEFQAYWIRFKSSEPCTATAHLVYE
ncbi:hypothetical protein HZ994_08100 [Akkermansiaceae bacterium]|nr:hypothetical protein HZ994_08100 [Akkermansiaceae bacterium]